MESAMPPMVAMRPIQKIVRVGGALVDVGLVDVVGPDGVEGGDVRGHAGHETREQSGEAETEDSRGKVAQKHDRDGEIVVVDGLAVGVEDRVAGDSVGFLRDDSVGVVGIERDGTDMLATVAAGAGAACEVRLTAMRPGRITRNGKASSGWRR